MELYEGIAENLSKVEGNLCPICEKASHDTTKDAKEGKADYVSRPSNLKCKVIPQAKSIANYSTAAHHLICVNECFLPFHRLSQMAMAVGYDVNNHRNGLSLPTVGQKSRNKYYLGGKRQKFGKFDVDEQREISFEIMKYLDSKPSNYFAAQWHTGHHDWSWDKVDELFNNTDNIRHGSNYERKVKNRLKEIEDQIVARKKSICKPDENGERGKKVSDALNDLSEDIKKGIIGWKTYFVSAAAYAFYWKNKRS